MQERRATIRMNHASRAQYCPAEDLLPRDGRLMNLSERGAGLLVREPHPEGEQITISFAFPGDEETTTATGAVRWSEANPAGGGWHRVGLQWLPLEEVTRNRLHRFLYQQTKQGVTRASTGGAGAAWRFRAWGSLVAWLGVAILALIGVNLAQRLHALQGKNSWLGQVVEERNAFIHQLKTREATLQSQLSATRGYLAETAAEVSRLDQHAQGLGGQIQLLNKEVERFQQSYVKVREERGSLLQHVLDLEQERLALSRRLVSSQEVSLVVREAIESRKRALQARERPQMKGERRLSDLEIVGNEGYIIRDGHPTLGRSTMWIRVYDPEQPQTAPTATTASAAQPAGALKPQRAPSSGKGGAGRMVVIRQPLPASGHAPGAPAHPALPPSPAPAKPSGSLGTFLLEPDSTTQPISLAPLPDNNPRPASAGTADSATAEQGTGAATTQAGASRESTPSPSTSPVGAP